MQNASKQKGSFIELVLCKYLSLEEFASALGVSSKVLNGRLADFDQWRLSEVTKACQLLKVQPSELERRLGV